MEELITLSAEEVAALVSIKEKRKIAMEHREKFACEERRRSKLRKLFKLVACCGGAILIIILGTLFYSGLTHQFWLADFVPQWSLCFPLAMIVLPHTFGTDRLENQFLKKFAETYPEEAKLIAISLDDGSS